jgi:hypothetical protein
MSAVGAGRRACWPGHARARSLGRRRPWRRSARCARPRACVPRRRRGDPSCGYRREMPSSSVPAWTRRRWRRGASARSTSRSRSCGTPTGPVDRSREVARPAEPKHVDVAGGIELGRLDVGRRSLHRRERRLASGSQPRRANEGSEGVAGIERIERVIPRGQHAAAVVGGQRGTELPRVLPHGIRIERDRRRPTRSASCAG